MKNKRYSSRYQFNLAMNKEEFNTLQKLREDYSVNISGCFKRFLSQYLCQLETITTDKKAANERHKME